jgi:hypothetical protein
MGSLPTAVREIALAGARPYLRFTHHGGDQEDGVDRGPSKAKPNSAPAFEKLQSEREAKAVEEERERDEEER